MVDFERELGTLLKAPYSFIHLVTYDEARATSFVTRLGRREGREVLEWSLTRGLSGSGAAVPPGDFHALLDAIESIKEPHIFIVKDPHPFMEDPATVRRLREMEGPLAAFGKTVVTISPRRLQPGDLATDVTELHVPLPDRKGLEEISRVVFPPERWPDLDRDSLVGGALGLTSRQALRAFHRSYIESEAAQREGLENYNMSAAVLDEKRRTVGSSEVVEFFESGLGLDDVGGLDELKLWLESRRDAFGQRARDFGLPAPKGLLLLGVQGCGKSLMAKAVAHFWGLPLLRLDIGSLFAGRRSPEMALKQALQTSEAISPAVLWVDELEKAFDPSGGGGQHRLLGSLLTWLQEKRAPVFFVATANSVQNLPPELLRKGRFDEIFFVDLPDRRAREQILGIHLRRRDRAEGEFDCRKIAELAANFSGAELEEVVVSALYLAFGQRAKLSQEHLEQAAKQTVPLFKTSEEEIKALRAWAGERARAASRDATLFEFFGSKRPAPRS